MLVIGWAKVGDDSRATGQCYHPALRGRLFGWSVCQWFRITMGLVAHAAVTWLE